MQRAGARDADLRTPLLQPETPDDENGLVGAATARTPYFDIVPLSAIDLFEDEHEQDEEDLEEEAERAKNLQGKWGFAWRLWYQLA